MRRWPEEHTMYRSVVVPLDGSRFGEQALPLALGIARRARARLRLVHVHQPLSVDGLATCYEAEAPRFQERERTYLEGVVQQLTSTAPIAVDWALLEGDVAGAVHAHVVGTEADFVVMSTHGRGPLSRLWMGSVADELVRRLPVPVLLLRPEEKPPELSQGRLFRRVLIPLDGSPAAEGILGPAIDLGNLAEAEYLLVRVVRPVPVVGLDLFGYATGGLDLAQGAKLEADARAYLDGVAARLRSRSASLRVQTTVVVDNHPASAILETVLVQGADLIALATRGRGGLKRLLLGSVADKVMRGAPIPVLLYRPLD